MKDYYQILRISRLANAAEIKRAYRRLAVVFHPDKNPSVDALSLFQEINEAHAVLSDPVKRSIYDQMLMGASSAPVDVEPAQPYHRDPAIRRRQQRGYKPRQAQPSNRLLMMVHLLRYYKIVCFAGLAWCAILVIDYSLPSRVNKEKLLSDTETAGMRRKYNSAFVVGTEEGNQFPLNKEQRPHFKAGTVASVNRSRLLNIMISVVSQDKQSEITAFPTVYQSFIFMPVVLFVLSLIGLRMENGIEFRFSFMMSIVVMMFFNFLFLLASMF